MATILIDKFISLALFVGLMPIIAQIANQHPIGILASSIIIVCMLIVLMPELMLVSRSYRKELLSGIQDADGKTNREDLKFFASWVMPVVLVQTVVLISLFTIVTEREAPMSILAILMGGAAGTSISPIAKLFKGKND